MPNKTLLVTELPEGTTPEKVKEVIQQKYYVKVVEVGAVIRKGSITSVQAVYAPANEHEDPPPATTFAQLTARTAVPR